MLTTIAKGTTFTKTLQTHDVYQMVANCAGQDFTGTAVSASKPVAVFAGSACANIPGGTTYCDHIEEQVLPVSTWGTQFFAVNFMPRGQNPENDSWKIIAHEDKTAFTLVGAPQTVSKLEAGESYQVDAASAFMVASDKPISVVHLMHGQGAVQVPVAPIYNEEFETPDGCAMDNGQANIGDPAMSVVVPFEQFLDEYQFLTPDTYRYDFLTFTAKSPTDPQIEMDGVAVPLTWSTLPGSDLRFARVRVEDGPHRVTGNVPFGIEVHGYDCNVSYAYPGGLRLETINID
jgi:hypothetical protein